MNIPDIQKILTEIPLGDTGKNIIESGAVSEIRIMGSNITFSLRLTEEQQAWKEALEEACVQILKQQLGTDIEVSITHKLRKGQNPSLKNVKNLIAITSGKGGVGKSTVAANLAISMAKQGYKVGLIDADVYGPSIPNMFDVEAAQPRSIKLQEGGKDYIEPITSYGVKILSIGFFVKPSDAVIWRGAIASNALKQLLMDTAWGELDYLFIDMPPGTGDIHLTLVQLTGVTGAIIVSTPQKIALLDALKGINMFREDKINVPILGLVENMSWFTPEELPNSKYYLFGKNGVAELAENEQTVLLGQIPLVQKIREGGDSGVPAVLENEITKEAFLTVAKNVVKSTEKRNKEAPPTKRVITAKQ